VRSHPRHTIEDVCRAEAIFIEEVAAAALRWLTAQL